MEQQTGIVQTIAMKRKARVMIPRRPACNHCGASSGYCIAAGPDRVEIEAWNPVGAVPGDMVSLRIAPTLWIKGAAVLYLCGPRCTCIHAILYFAGFSQSRLEK